MGARNQPQIITIIIMNIIPIAAVQYQAPGNKLEAIEGCITKVWPERKESQPGEQNPWSFQSAEFRGLDGQTIRIKFKNFPPVGNDWCGHPVRFVASTDPRAKGIVVEEHNGKKSLILNRPTVEEDWNVDFQAPAASAGPPATQTQNRAAGPPGAHGPPQSYHGQGHGPDNRPPQRQQGPPPSQHSGPPRQGPPAQSQQGPPQGQRPATMPVHGQTVGMAVNNAVKIITGWDVPPVYFSTSAFSLDVYTIASDLIRVAAMLEKGKLATPAKDRKPADQPEMRPAATPKDQDQYIEPDHSHDPPPNSRESHQREDHPPQDGPHHSERQSAFPSGGSQPGMDDDDIPF